MIDPQCDYREKKFFLQFFSYLKNKSFELRETLVSVICGKDWMDGGGDKSGRKKFSHNAE